MFLPARVGSKRLLVGLLVCCACSLAGAFAAATSQAVVYSTPTEPFTNPTTGVASSECSAIGIPVVKEGSEGYVTAHELEAFANNTTAQCKVFVTAFIELARRSFWVTEELLHLQEKTTKLESTLSTALVKLESAIVKSEVTLHADLVPKDGLPVSIKSSSTVPISDSASSQYSEKLVSAVDSSGEASKAGLYMLVGVVVAFFIGLMLAKVVDRGL